METRARHGLPGQGTCPVCLQHWLSFSALECTVIPLTCPSKLQELIVTSSLTAALGWEQGRSTAMPGQALLRELCQHREALPPSQVLSEATARPSTGQVDSGLLLHPCPPTPISLGTLTRTSCLPQGLAGGSPFSPLPRAHMSQSMAGFSDGRQWVTLGAGREIQSGGFRRPQVGPGVLGHGKHTKSGQAGSLYRAEKGGDGTQEAAGPATHYLAPSSGLPSPSVLPSSSVFRSSVLSFCSFFLLTHLTTISTKMTTARKPPTEAPTITATVESRSGGSGKEGEPLSTRAGKGASPPPHYPWHAWNHPDFTLLRR